MAFLFQLTLEKWSCSKAQQQWFLELIYDHQSVFSLCDKDLGLCDCLKHTIPTTTDKPVYLPAPCTIPVQLQTEVHTCLDTWLKQGIIHPSQSPYMSQVVIVHKNLGKSTYAYISKLSMPLLFTIHFFYHISRKLYKLLKLQYGLPHSIWLRVIYNWTWKRLIFIKQLSM